MAFEFLALDTDSEEPIVPAKKVKISDSEEAAKLQNDDEEVPAKAVKKLKKVVKRMSRTVSADAVFALSVFLKPFEVHSIFYYFEEKSRKNV